MLLAVAVVAGCEPRDEPETARDAPTPDQVATALDAASEYLRTEEVDKAEVILARLVERAPDEPRGHELLGQVLSLRAAKDPVGRDARRAEAADHYDVAARLDPDDPGLRHAAGVVAMTAGRTEAALAHFQAARRLVPNDPQYDLFAAQALLQLGRLDEAEAAIEAALAVDPDEPIAHASLAMIALERGAFDEARAHVAEARAIAPSDDRFRVQQARVLRRSGDPRAALELLLPLPIENRVAIGATIEVAEAYAALGDDARCAEAWAAHHARRPELGSALGAGAALERAGRYAEARQWLLEARRLDPASPEVAELAERLGDG